MEDIAQWVIPVIWIQILLGMFSGAVMGLKFANENWLGGYGSWRRRMARLAHISFFGLALVNLAFFFSLFFYVHHEGRNEALLHTTVLMLLAGSVLMPTVCYLAAWRKPLRHLFALPVVCLIGGASLTIYMILFTARLDT